MRIQKGFSRVKNVVGVLEERIAISKTNMWSIQHITINIWYWQTRR